MERKTNGSATADELLEQIKVEHQKHYEQQLENWNQAVKAWEANGKEGKKPRKPMKPSNELQLSSSRIAQLNAPPKGWEWNIVNNLLQYGRSCAYGVLKPGPDTNEGIRLIRVGDIRNGAIDISNMKRISKTIADKYQRTYLQGGEMLISLVGAIGRTAVVPNSLAGSNTARAVGVIPFSKLLNVKFLELYFRSEAKIQEMTSLAHEVARKTLNLENVRDASVLLPSLEEQHQIVQEIESRLSVCDKVEESITESIEKAQALRQSILKKAFEGTLLSEEEISACKAAPDYEPASVLLEKIKSEKKK
jgi:type I restriction enzyme S subunit